MLIGGELVDARSGEQLTASNPATGQAIGTFPKGNADDVDAAVAAGSAAFPEWRDTPPLQRAAAINAVAAAIEANGDELAYIDTLDNGSPLHEMRRDIAIAAYQLRYFAGLVLEVTGKTVPTTSGVHQYTTREPFGVVGRIVAFNHPILFAASRIAGPLVVGNTVVLKPSERTSLSALRMGEILADVLPPGVLNIVSGTGLDVGDSLVRHREVRRVGFTGSLLTGKKLQAAAAESPSVTTVTLELGGKNPLIVFADADIEAAVEGAVRGMNFTWQGQSCGSTSRVYVERPIFDKFAESVAARMNAMIVGDPLDPSSDSGVIAFEEHYDRVRDHIIEAADDDRLQLLAGAAPPARGAGTDLKIRPTLFATESDDVTVVQEEVFGPVLVALPFDNYEEVMERANATNYGLTASIWTGSLDTALKAARDIQAGYVWINGSAAHVPGAPFGGYKDSGIGREEDLDELLSYTQLKSVVIRW